MLRVQKVRFGLTFLNMMLVRKITVVLFLFLMFFVSQKVFLKSSHCNSCLRKGVFWTVFSLCEHILDKLKDLTIKYLIFYHQGSRVNYPPPPPRPLFRRRQQKFGGWVLYKRPFFTTGKKVNGLIAPLFFRKIAERGRGQLTRIPLIRRFCDFMVQWFQFLRKKCSDLSNEHHMHESKRCFYETL